jgi:hypothetical protein
MQTPLLLNGTVASNDGPFGVAPVVGADNGLSVHAASSPRAAIVVQVREKFRFIGGVPPSAF